MWSLPDIVRMNNEAASAGAKAKIAKALKGKADVECDNCGKKATHIQEYFDIFSDDAKGVVAQCDSCEDRQGSIPEGYFYCSDCERLMIENYTWEMYYRIIEGEQVCLPCAAKRYIEDPASWIKLTKKGIDAVTFERVRKAPHVIGVRMPTPKGIVFYANTEMDSSTGGRLTGFSSAESGPEGAVIEIRNSLRKAKAEGHKRAILILDATYQFSVSLGIYVPEAKRGTKG